MTTPFPFKILGTSDDGQLCFLDRGNRFKQTPSRSLNKSFLLTLAQVEWWRDQYRHPTANEKSKDPVDWDIAISDMMEFSQKEFDFNNTKGLGAWRSKSGEVCYHNGNPDKIVGKKPKDWVFIRKSTKDIGLNAQHVSPEIRAEILKTVESLSFETPQDGIRLLCWATLAPFAGALPWRCSGLITGGSGSGKSAVVDNIVKPLVGDSGLYASGGSSEAGIRQSTAVDAIPVILEEVEADSQRERENRDGLFKLMRQSTSDDTPAIYKGGKDGTSQAFNLKCMFLFIGISPQVEKEADENRLFFCNVKKSPPGGDKNWTANRANLKRLMVKKNMDGVRSLVWDKLQKIIDNIDKFEDIIQEVAGLGGRQATAEAPLLAAYTVIWLGIENPNKGQFKEIVRKFYDGFEVEKRDETEEMVDKLLDIPVTITETRERHTIREMLIMLNTGRSLGEHEADFDAALGVKDKNILRQTLYHCGVVLAPGKYGPGAIGIAKDHGFIMKELQVGRGYQKQFFRHDKFAEKSYPITVNTLQRGYVILRGMI